ncbi:hypothetical protein AMECASPLE_032354 [Ameca splendens]|uniref:Secreted protein n=1 Tax=Ameca splendens TaxID=208324 RepID=A0ABV0YU01_9TELE
MLATHLQKAIEITKLCFLLFGFHFGHIVNQKASEMCRWVILMFARSSLVQGDCFMLPSPSVSSHCVTLVTYPDGLFTVPKQRLCLHTCRLSHRKRTHTAVKIHALCSTCS